ncbi:formate-dependent phosphoribosylglycinamide formyltransferase [Robiginitomaculum antarcticum]|uniref:formate-dependent phosphoribosylglycinamide formyltransferase n=1 Tax=Robiginitomaculum antarcticum TaxID=437507 RepID=UPI00037742CC|nr:formate-dependent phosphoribosylglycinamide formyltransferase [Robiginitomaculum antarcticum]
MSGGVRLGTALRRGATKVLFCGAGELGKEVVIALQRLGVETIALDRYPDAPAMQVAHRSHVVDMRDGKALRAIIELEQPDLIVPEIEAIATATLAELEREGYTVIPTAKAAQLTMDREGIRRLAAEDLGLRTSPYRFADTEDEVREAMAQIGLPCVVKPVMSSSGKGQSTAFTEADISRVWAYSQTGGRTGASRVIVEGFVDFDYEITLLTVRHAGGTSFCAPIGHRQDGGDYQESWQPHPMSPAALQNAQDMAGKITAALGGYGVFGVELFIKGDVVIFSEVSPRPHDTGLVTLVSQNLSEFELHARAILGLPIPQIIQTGPAASAVILGEGHSSDIAFDGVADALSEAGVDIRLFGKPEISGVRRLGVALATDETIDIAREKALRAAGKVKVRFLDACGAGKSLD